MTVKYLQSHRSVPCWSFLRWPVTLVVRGLKELAIQGRECWWIEELTSSGCNPFCLYLRVTREMVECQLPSRRLKMWANAVSCLNEVQKIRREPSKIYEH